MSWNSIEQQSFVIKHEIQGVACKEITFLFGFMGLSSVELERVRGKQAPGSEHVIRTSFAKRGTTLAAWLVLTWAGV